MIHSETPTTATTDPPVTYVEQQLRRRRRWLLVPLVIALVLLLLGLAVAVAGLIAGARLLRNSTVYYPDNIEHFERGSIGADEGSGLPYWVWQALPRLFPAEFDGHLDYRAFGFLYRTDRNGRQEDLPIGAIIRASIWSGSTVRSATPARTGRRKAPSA